MRRPMHAWPMTSGLFSLNHGYHREHRVHREAHFSVAIRPAILLLALVCAGATIDAQSRAAAKRQPAPPPLAPLEKIVPEMTCPTPLGIGVATRVAYCDVM